MECLTCNRLVKEFTEATTQYFTAVDYLSNVVESNDHKDHDRQMRSFLEAYARARREFDNCQRARNAVEDHRRSVHRFSGHRPQPSKRGHNRHGLEDSSSVSSRQTCHPHAQATTLKKASEIETVSS